MCCSVLMLTLQSKEPEMSYQIAYVHRGYKRMVATCNIIPRVGERVIVRQRIEITHGA
jgi:hypothetical protein